MMAGMYAAISGLDANQAMLNETANDLANVNTVGYKGASVTFANELTQVMHGASAPTSTNGGTNPAQIGLGVMVNATVNEMTEGSFQTTRQSRRDRRAWCPWPSRPSAKRRASCAE